MAVFDTEMTHIVNTWLEASSTYNDTRMMLIANDIKTYNSFKSLDKEEIYALEQIKTNGAPTKLRSHHVKQVTNTREYISFLGSSGERALANDPTKWVRDDFNTWQSKGKPMGPNATFLTGAGTAVTIAVTTTAAEKLQKVDDNRLQIWKRGNKDAKDYPMLENDK